MTAHPTADDVVLAALRRNPVAISTTRVRDLVNADHPNPLAAEQVYRILRKLVARGEVARVQAPGQRKCFWQATARSGHKGS